MKTRNVDSNHLTQPSYRKFCAKWIPIWLAIGILWFLLGIAWAPSIKIYRQGLIALLWAPAMLTLFLEWDVFRNFISRNKGLATTILLFLAWSTISLAWSSAESYSREIRRLVFIALFLCGMIYVDSRESRYNAMNLMTISAYGLALAALVSILIHYGIEGNPFSSRLSGIGLINHPILGGYVMGLMMLWLTTFIPRGNKTRPLGLLCIAVMLAFIVLTQSRGLWAALLGSALVYGLLAGGRKHWFLAGGLLLCAAIGYWQFSSYIMARGTSFRPEIFEASIRMISENPWTGLGLASEYDISYGAYIFPHSHNIFTHIAIELGIPGLTLWLLIWGYGIKTAWLYRHALGGSALLKIFIFCSIALLFDGGSLLKSPRPEWFVSWLPVALAAGLHAQWRTRKNDKPSAIHD